MLVRITVKRTGQHLRNPNTNLPKRDICTLSKPLPGSSRPGRWQQRERRRRTQRRK